MYVYTPKGFPGSTAVENPLGIHEPGDVGSIPGLVVAYCRVGDH